MTQVTSERETLNHGSIHVKLKSLGEKLLKKLKMTK